MKDYYKILNVTRTASAEEINYNYRVLAKRYHPDLHPGDRAAAERFKDINEAREVLSDPQKRADYDVQINMSELIEQQKSWQEQRARLQAQQQLFQKRLVGLDPVLARELRQAYSSGYQFGYATGLTDQQSSMAALGSRVNALTDENTRLKVEVARYKQMVESRDRELDERSERLFELDEQLRWLKNATNLDTSHLTDPLKDRAARTHLTVNELKAQIDKAVVSPGNLAENITTLVQQERRKEIREELLKLDKAVKKLSDELDDIAAVEEQKRLLVDTEQYFKSIEQSAERWTKKVKEDRRLAKPTLYGLFGVLIWATEIEIDDAYARLAKRYAAHSDDESADKLQKLTDAYAILSDPKKRKKYNDSIGFSETMINSERRLINENARMQAEYHGKLEEKAFWARFDDLSSLALAGDADAQNAMGEIFFNGTTVRTNYDHALYWFMEAFEQGHPKATYNLGVCYERGLGTEKSESIAKSLYRQASFLGIDVPTPAV